MALFSMVPEGAVLDWAAIYLGKELGAGPFRPRAWPLPSSPAPWR
jgi:hypothetical protein